MGKNLRCKGGFGQATVGRDIGRRFCQDTATHFCVPPNELLLNAPIRGRLGLNMGAESRCEDLGSWGRNLLQKFHCAADSMISRVFLKD